MATVFWARKGVLMVEFMQQGTTITSEVYCKMLKELHRAIQNKRCGMLTYGVVLLYDNAYSRSHSSTAGSFQLGVVRAQRFNNDEELMEGVKMSLSLQAADCFDTRHTKTYSPIQVPQFQQ
jgi:hypothetical protein